MEAKEVLEDVFNEHEHRMADMPMNDDLKAVIAAMERHSNLRIIEVLENVLNEYIKDGSYNLEGRLENIISELKSQLPLSTEDSNNDIPNSVGGGF